MTLISPENSKNELQEWFGPLELSVNGGDEVPVAPSKEEMAVLLELGKVAAEKGPQRFYALLTAFAVGRALGRAEVGESVTDPVALLQKWLDATRSA